MSTDTTISVHDWKSLVQSSGNWVVRGRIRGRDNDTIHEQHAGWARVIDKILMLSTWGHVQNSAAMWPVLVGGKNHEKKRNKKIKGTTMLHVSFTNFTSATQVIGFEILFGWFIIYNMTPLQVRGERLRGRTYYREMPSDARKRTSLSPDPHSINMSLLGHPSVNSVPSGLCHAKRSLISVWRFFRWAEITMEKTEKPSRKQ